MVTSTTSAEQSESNLGCLLAPNQDKEMHHINRGPHKNRTAGVCVHVCVCAHAYWSSPPQGALVSGSIWSPDGFCCSTSAGFVCVCYRLCVSLMALYVFNEHVLMQLYPLSTATFTTNPLLM